MQNEVNALAQRIADLEAYMIDRRVVARLLMSEKIN
jgi:hypothetical protein